MNNKNKVKKVSSIVKEIINQDQLINGINNVKVINSCKKIFGKNIINYIETIKFKNGDLYIKLKSAPLRNELNFKKEILLKNINTDLKEKIVQKIIFN